MAAAASSRVKNALAALAPLSRLPRFRNALRPGRQRSRPLAYTRTFGATPKHMMGITLLPRGSRAIAIVRAKTPRSQVPLQGCGILQDAAPPNFPTGFPPKRDPSRAPKEQPVRGPASPASAERATRGGLRRSSTPSPAGQRMKLMPNPSFNRTRYGRPPWPGWRYAVHFRQPGQGVLP